MNSIPIFSCLRRLKKESPSELGPSGITVNMVSGVLLRATDASVATPAAVFDQIVDDQTANLTPLRFGPNTGRSCGCRAVLRQPLGAR